MSSRPLRLVLALPLLVLCAGPARAATIEEVILGRTGYDDAVAERASGERLRLDLRGCTDLRGYSGRAALLWSPGTGPGPESRLLIPEFDLSCAVLRVDTLQRAPDVPTAPAIPEEGLRAVRQALELQGFDCGPPGSGWSPEADLAFLRFRESRRLDANDQGLRRTVTSLAMESIRGRQASGTGMRLARILTDQRDALARWFARPGAGARSGCREPAWIRTNDGTTLALSDRTFWQALPAGRGTISTWSAGDAVTVCSGRLIHWPTGTMVPVTAATTATTGR